MAAAASTGIRQLTSIVVLHGNIHPSTNSIRCPMTIMELENVDSMPRTSGSLISPMYAIVGASKNPMLMPMVAEAVYSIHEDSAEYSRYQAARWGTFTSSKHRFRPNTLCTQADSTQPRGWHIKSMLAAAETQTLFYES